MSRPKSKEDQNETPDVSSAEEEEFSDSDIEIISDSEEEHYKILVPIRIPKDLNPSKRKAKLAKLLNESLKQLSHRVSPDRRSNTSSRKS